MKRWGLLCAGILLFAGIASAQDNPKVEVFGGYSYLLSSVGGGYPTTNFNAGGSGSVAFNLNNWFGVVGDFGGYHTGNFAGFHTSANVISYTGGPKFSYRSDKFTLFAQSLFGGARVSSGGASLNSFAMALGGGADVNVSPHFAIRAIQAEYVLTRFKYGGGTPNSQNNARISVGVVIKF
ncbi:MAG: outer membrane beta-barrel protein [Candidatus Acidiferrales bacterium]